MVKIMEIPIKMDDLGGKTPIFGNTHLFWDEPLGWVRKSEVTLFFLLKLHLDDGHVVPKVFFRGCLRVDVKGETAGF